MFRHYCPILTKISVCPQILVKVSYKILSGDYPCQYWEKTNVSETRSVSIIMENDLITATIRQILELFLIWVT
jgi:hypothetical protein